MDNESCYKVKLPEITAIKDKDIIVTLKTPVSIYLQEAENLYHWSQNDKTDLTNAGLDWSLVIDIPIRAGALREAEVLWHDEFNNYRVKKKEWKEKSIKLLQTRNALLHEFRFAYRKNSQLLSQIRTIASSKANHAMIQALNDLAILGKANPCPLEAINFDLSYLDKVSALSQEMAAFYAIAILDHEKNAAKKVRQQAITYLKYAVDEVKSYGYFVFRNNKDRRQGYTSYYFHKTKKKSA